MQKSRRRLWEAYLESSSRLTNIRASKMVIHMDDDIVAINKPPGVPVHDGPGVKPDSSLTANLSHWQFNKDTPPALAHRIDKNTTGVVILTRHQDSARRIAGLFRERKVIKKYCALCVGVPEKHQGSVEIPLGLKNVSTTNRQRKMHRVVLRQDQADASTQGEAGHTLPGRVQLAWTNYSLISRAGSVCSLLEVTPVTGFRHQIRVHLADGLMCPVVGDYKFGGPLFRLQKSLARKMEVIGSTKGYTRGPMYLHAHQVVIPLSEGKPLVINAPLPTYFIKTTRSLGLAFPKNFQKFLT